MAKNHNQYVCQSCGSTSSKWAGKCDACGGWNTLVEEETTSNVPKSMGRGKANKLGFTSLGEHTEAPPRLTTNINELDRVLGGGLVAGSAILIGGDPGIGKSTLLLQMTASLAKAGTKVAYVSGEESVGQVQLRALRLGVADAPVQLAAANSVRDIIASLDNVDKPDLVVIDSVQTMFVDTLDSAPGTVAQVRAVAHEFIRFAKKRGVIVILVGHVTKDGQIAGPRVLEHMVDCVLYFEGERGHLFRILRAVKNRFGAVDEIGIFEMTELGLSEVANPSSLFLSERDAPVSGSAVFAGMEGTRPVLVEIQALVAPSTMATPRRAVVGWDTGRLAMILAVLETRAGIKFSDREVYLNVAGGMKINEPAADLAVTAALLSAVFDTPMPNHSVFCGEIGLSGEVRAVSRQDARLKESAKLGFKLAFIPPLPSNQKASGNNQTTLATTPLNHVQDVVRFVRHCQQN